MTEYVEIDTLNIVSSGHLLKKHRKSKAAGVPLSAADLIDMNAAILEGSMTGDVATGKAMMYGSMYQREYRKHTTEELIAKERGWRNQQFPLVEIAMNRVQANHSSKVGTVGEWYDYQNALRDYPQGEGFPDRTLNPRPKEPR